MKENRGVVNSAPVFLFVHLCLAASLEDGKGIESQGFHLVLAWETLDGCKESDAAAQRIDNIFRMRQTACQQNGIYVTA